MKSNRHLYAAMVLASSALLSACGGGGGSGSNPAPPPPPDLSLAGSAIKGPVYNGTVTVLTATVPPTAVAGASCTNTLPDGSYSCTIPGGAVGPFQVRLEGGVYCSDESQVIVAEGGATSCPGTAQPKNGGEGADAMSTIVLESVNGELASAPITPFTTAATTVAISSESGALNFLSTYAEVATTYGIDTNPTAAVDFNNTDSRAVALLKEMAESEAPLSELTANIQQGANPTTGGDLSTSAAVASTPSDESTATDGLQVSEGSVEDEIITGGTSGAGGSTQ
jgi:hypothetical protein